ncbi:MAG: beta-propeller fold lactonase family protein [Gammaproteobacteria bacterium]|nr:beta-propeller fold lactonase family protein [Gammaproteobacteria bacterium]
MARLFSILLTLTIVAGYLPGSFGQAHAGELGSGTLVVLNKSGHTAELIDLGTGKKRAVLPTGNYPHEVAVSPDGKLAVITCYGDRDNPGSSLTLINIPQKTVIKTIELTDYSRPHGIQWLADGRSVVVTAESRKALLRVSIPEGRILAAMDTGQEISHMVAVSPDGSHAYVSSIGSGSVTVFALSSGKRVKVLATGKGAEGIAVTPDGRELWVSNRGEDSISVIDTGTLDIKHTIASPTFPIRLAISANGHYALASNARSGDVAVFNARTHTELARIDLGLEASTTEGRLFGNRFGKSPVPIGVLVHPDGGRAFVANANADLVSVIDMKKLKVIRHIAVGKEPDGLGYSPRVIDQNG